MTFNFTEEKRRSTSADITEIDSILIIILNRGGKRARWVNLNYYYKKL